MIEIQRYTGGEVRPWLRDLARLRLTVFREYPYLYEGNEDMEMENLESYARTPHSVFVLALADGEVAGISTGRPLADADDSFVPLFREAGIDGESVFYLGESVLRADLRDQGTGHRFFDEREAHALTCGYTAAAFCAVQRRADHPARPEGYRPLDLFWSGRGYVKIPHFTTRMEWLRSDTGARAENELVFWLNPALGRKK
jgi:GNAT superfamily N-acetyltransferase